MLPTAADEEDPTAVLWGKEVRMGPGRVTSTVEGWMTTRESSHCLTQGSLQLLASGVGPQGLQKLLQAMSVVWSVPVREGVEEAESGGGREGCRYRRARECGGAVWGCGERGGVESWGLLSLVSARAGRDGACGAGEGGEGASGSPC